MAQTTEDQLEIAARESLHFIVQALRGGKHTDDAEGRVLLSAATSTLSSYTRNRATTSAMQQTALVRARMLADVTTGPVVAGLLAAGEGDGD